MKSNTNTNTNLILIAIIGILALFSIYNFVKLQRISTNDTPKTASSNLVFERVTKSGELRVGYLVFPPYLNKETSSGKLSGIFYNVTEQMGSSLNLKVNWVEEVNLATLSEGLDAGRFDMIAFPLWRSSARAKNVAFSTPLFYSTLGIYVRSDDSRFDKNISSLNDPSVTVATMDGELAAEIAKTDFPKAKISPLPQLADYNQLLLEISTKKADVTFFNKVMAERYIQKNPGKLKDISGEKPIRVFAECFILPLNDSMFRSMIDSTLLEMIENGQIDQAFISNGENPNEYFRPAIPYRNPSK